MNKHELFYKMFNYLLFYYIYIYLYYYIYYVVNVFVVQIYDSRQTNKISS